MLRITEKFNKVGKKENVSTYNTFLQTFSYILKPNLNLILKHIINLPTYSHD
jgi:hypothetical protein